jgi:hypothetical protein
MLQAWNGDDVSGGYLAIYQQLPVDAEKPPRVVVIVIPSDAQLAYSVIVVLFLTIVTARTKCFVGNFVDCTIRRY